MTPGDPDAEDLGFELVPSEESAISPEEDLEAAIASALAPEYAEIPGEIPEPLGRTWAFDWDRGRFIRRGQAPAEVTGKDSVAQWVQMVVHTARFSHGVFSTEFGIEDVEDVIGRLPSGAVLSSYRDRLLRALLEHERITGLEDFKADYDPATDVIEIKQFVVVLDDEDDRIVFGTQEG